MKLLAKLLLLSHVSLLQAADDFSDIPMANEDTFDRSAEKKVKMAVQRSKSYRDLVKDSMFQHHLSVRADSDDHSIGNMETPVDQLEGRLNFDIRDHDRMQYFTLMYIGSEK